jgi:hypothetical protein
LRLDIPTPKWRPRNSLKQRIHSTGNKILPSNSSLRDSRVSIQKLITNAEQL